MKKRIRLLASLLTVMAFVVILTNSCKKDEANVPVLTTSEITNITLTSATCGGNISSDGGSAVTARGICWSTNTSPTLNDNKTIDSMGTGIYKSYMTGLSPNTKYYVRAYATNSVGTGYGNVMLFLTQPLVTDIDGNIYQTVTIGTQVWMVENLKTIHYRNGDPITNVTDSMQWRNFTTGAYCWYNNDSATYKTTYGALYNWYAVNDSRNIAPTGWHVPTDDEWYTLTSYLGGEEVAGGKLKEMGTEHWYIPNTGANNITGYTALPGGSRNSLGTFGYVGYDGNWWSSTQFYSLYAWLRIIRYDYSILHTDKSSKLYGYSVRCIKD